MEEDEMTYRILGETVTLEACCRREPEWAANRLRVMRAALEKVLEECSINGDTDRIREIVEEVLR
jgi:hypothetical protein